jgi:hypothetical protein
MNKLILQFSLLMGSLIILSTILISGLGLLQNTHSHAGMHTVTCPYMVGQHSICPIESLFDIENLQAFSKAIFPLLELLILSAVLFVALKWILVKEPLTFLYIKQRHRVVPIPLHSNLFSEGILHPKAP